MKGFLIGRYPVWLLGAVLGGYSQLSWLLAHGRQDTFWRLALGMAAGAGLAWLAAEAAALAARFLGWRPWLQAERLGRFLAGTAWTLSGLSSRGGRRAWLGGLALTMVLAAWPVHQQLLKPAQGAYLVRHYFLDHREPSGPNGLRSLLFEGLDQAGPLSDLGVLDHWGFANLADIPGGLEKDFVLRCLGLIFVPHTGVYGFGGQVDDGMLLLVDGRVVVDQQMEGPPKQVWGKTFLIAGWHALDVSFLQYAGGATLKLQWQPPGSDRQPLGQAQLLPLRAGTPLSPITRLILAHGLAPRPFSTYDPWQSGRFWDLPW
jgi:hypothetical protein